MRRFLLLTCAIVAGIALAFGLNLSKHNLTPPSTGNYVRSGRLTEIARDHLTLIDGEGEWRYPLSKEVAVERPVGHQLVWDKNVSRLRIGDNVDVIAVTLPYNEPHVVSVSANGFVTRDGVITAVGSDYLEVRIRVSKNSTEYASDPTRVYVSPTAKQQALLRPPASTTFPATMRSASLHDYQVGTLVSFDGFLADNGDWVAQDVTTAFVSP